MGLFPFSLMVDKKKVLEPCRYAQAYSTFFLGSVRVRIIGSNDLAVKLGN